MNLEQMISERSQIPKSTYSVIHLLEMSRTGKLRDRKQTSDCQGLGRDDKAE